MIAEFSKLLLRRVSIFSPLRDSLREPLTHQPGKKKEETAKLWRKIFFFVCIPAMSLAGINVLLEEEPERPEFVPYSHLRLRTKPFPWKDGNKTLFHNPERNALPDGYET